VSRPRIALVLAVLALAALVGCGRDQPLSAQVGIESMAPADREPLPPIAGTTMDGKPLSLAEYRGRVVVLNSWASWCAPCRDEVPAFVELAGSVDPRKVAVVGLNVNDDPAAAGAFATEFAMTYPSIVDASGTILATVPGVPPAALPSTVIVDAKGAIAARIIGPAESTALSALVSSIEAESALP
jgi:thiol-disulfide isomerase/thioredoxin